MIISPPKTAYVPDPEQIERELARDSIRHRRKEFPTGIKALYTPEHAVLDIIFIHGLTQSREKTWTANASNRWTPPSHNNEPWISSLLPVEIPNARVLVFGYDAFVDEKMLEEVVSGNKAGKSARGLLEEIERIRVEEGTETRPIVFVCHGYGGLVCKKAMVQASQSLNPKFSNVFTSTIAIAFLGTPHPASTQGPFVRTLARYLMEGREKSLNRTEWDSYALNSITIDFHSLLQKDSGLRLQIACFYEKEAVPGVGFVVKAHDAVIPGHEHCGLRGNHFNMTKFMFKEDRGFKEMVAVLQRWVRQQQDQERKEA